MADLKFKKGFQGTADSIAAATENEKKQAAIPGTSPNLKAKYRVSATPEITGTDKEDLTTKNTGSLVPASPKP